MAGKKQITKKVKEETLQETEQVNAQVNEPSTTEQVGIQDNKFLPKSGRTLIVKSKDGLPFELSSFDNLTGLLTKTEIKQHNSLFLTFDTIEHSETASTFIAQNYNVKYSYYKVFFTLSTNIDNSNLEKLKQEMITFIESHTDSSLIHCKFYHKNSSYMNCGYLVVDTIDGMKKLISKESVLKQFKTENFSGTFYRFNNSKYNTQNTNSTQA